MPVLLLKKVLYVGEKQILKCIIWKIGCLN